MNEYYIKTKHLGGHLNTLKKTEVLGLILAEHH